MLGYWGLPDETRAAKTPDGWLLTGDLGCVDKEVCWLPRLLGAGNLLL